MVGSLAGDYHEILQFMGLWLTIPFVKSPNVLIRQLHSPLSKIRTLCLTCSSALLPRQYFMLWSTDIICWVLHATWVRNPQNSWLPLMSMESDNSVPSLVELSDIWMETNMDLVATHAISVYFCSKWPLPRHASWIQGNPENQCLGQGSLSAALLREATQLHLGLFLLGSNCLS